MRSDAGTLRIRLDENGQRDGDVFQPPHQLSLRRGYAVLPEFLLRPFLVEGNAADLLIGAGVGNTTRLENLLDLAVLSKSPVQREKGEIGAIRHDEGSVIDGDFGDLVSGFTQAASAAAAPVRSETSRSAEGPPMRTVRRRG